MKIRLIALLITCLLIVSTACGKAEPEPVEPAALPPIELSGETDDLNQVPKADEVTDDAGSADSDTLVSTTTADTYAALNVYQAMAQKLSISNQESAQENFSYELDFVMEMDMTLDDMFIPSGVMSGNIKVFIDGDLVKLAMVMDMSSMDAGMMEMYFDGTEGYLIVDDMVVPLEFDDIMGQFDGSLNLPDFEDKAIKSVEINQIGDNTEYIFVLDGKELSDFVIESMNNELDGLGIDFEIEIDDIIMVMVVDANERPLSLSMIMTMYMEVEGSTIIMNMKAAYDIIKWGEDVIISFPSL